VIVWQKLDRPLAVEVWEADVAGFKLRAFADGGWVISGWRTGVIESGRLTNDLEGAQHEVVEHARALFRKALEALDELDEVEPKK